MINEVKTQPSEKPQKKGGPFKNGRRRMTLGCLETWGRRGSGGSQSQSNILGGSLKIEA